MENKVVDFKIQDGKLLISVDPNKNGVALVKIEMELSEIPVEAIDAIKSFKK